MNMFARLKGLFVGSSLLPGGDTLGSGNMMDSLGKSMADIAGAGMPRGLLSQLFQFLMNLFTEGMKELGHQFNQSAAAAAADAAKKLSICGQIKLGELLAGEGIMLV